MGTPPNLFLRQLAEPAFDQVHPGCPGWREVQVKPGVPQQPAVDHRGFVGAVVVEDQVDLEVLGHRSIDGVQELPEFDGPMALMAFADDLSGLEVKGCKERRRAVTLVVVSASLDLPWAKRQKRLRPIQGLNPDLLT